MRSRELAANRVLESIVELLDIPQSYYEKAERRYESLGEWLHRDESTIARYDPAVYPQGSFRYGTVIRPLLKNEEYDLDLVVQLVLTKDSMTQARFKGKRPVNPIFSFAAGSVIMLSLLTRRHELWRTADCVI